jgi:hypothetical protein
MKVQGSERPVAHQPSSRIDESTETASARRFTPMRREKRSRSSAAKPEVASVALIAEWDLPFPLSYRGGKLLVEYATVGFRSREDCGPIAA